MPIYCFRCVKCGMTYELFFHNSQPVPSGMLCPACRFYTVERAMDLEGFNVRGDIQPHFNESLGEYVGSRREWREKLAYHNARDENLMQGSSPSGGRLTKEERAEVEGRLLPNKKTIFERRREPGWGEVPRDADSPIEVEGAADYKEIIDYGKRRAGRK